MQIPDVSVFTVTPVSTLTAMALRAGIGQRLALLTYLFCPDKESDPGDLLAQLKIDEVAGQVQLRWRPRMRYPPRGYRFGDELKDQLQMAKCGLRWYAQGSVGHAIQLIETSVDGVGFVHGYSRNDMGWPVVMAAAATIVDQAGGAIVTNGYGWFVPQGNEVRQMFDPQLDRTA